MSKERFQVSANQIGEIIVIDTSNDNVYRYDNISHFFGLIRILNELNDENEQLRNIIKQKEEEEKLYAKEILRLNELNKQTSEFTDILGGY